MWEFAHIPLLELAWEHSSCWLALSPPTHWDLCLDLWFMSDSAKWVVDLAAWISLVWGFQKPLIRGKSTVTGCWKYKVSTLCDKFRDFFIWGIFVLVIGKSCTLLTYTEPLWIFKLYFSQQIREKWHICLTFSIAVQCLVRSSKFLQTPNDPKPRSCYILDN